jgi:hypothetical protein
VSDNLFLHSMKNTPLELTDILGEKVRRDMYNSRPELLTERQRLRAQIEDACRRTQGAPQACAAVVGNVRNACDNCLLVAGLRREVLEG